MRERPFNQIIPKSSFSNYARLKNLKVARVLKRRQFVFPKFKTAHLSSKLLRLRGSGSTRPGLAQHVENITPNYVVLRWDAVQSCHVGVVIETDDSMNVCFPEVYLTVCVSKFSPSLIT